MRKVAIFVEGQTELIFVREFLLCWFNYQIDVECRTLFSGEKVMNADYDYSCETAGIHAQVINVGMDGNVLTRILGREQFLYNAGYDLIIGLRDMYSEEYRKVSKGRGVDVRLIENFKTGAAKTIQKQAKHAEFIRFCYAVMELETWWIGILSLWQNLPVDAHREYQDKFISPESILHPAEFVKELLNLASKSYSKHKGEVESIVSRISREDYIDLHESQRCPSFSEFVQHLQSSVEST
jgi:hypothetical protein